MTDDRDELERCKQENARLKELVVWLSEIVLRDVVKRAEEPNCREPMAQRDLSPPDKRDPARPSFR